MEYVWYGLSTLIGILIGVIINLLVEFINRHKLNMNNKQFFKYELNLNINKLEKWLEFLDKYRTCVIGDRIDKFFSYFDFESYVVNSSNKLFQSGELYNLLTLEEMSEFQIVCNNYNYGWSKIINDQVKSNKEKCCKEEVLIQIDFWEERLNTDKKTLEEIVKRVK